MTVGNSKHMLPTSTAESSESQEKTNHHEFSEFAQFVSTDGPAFTTTSTDGVLWMCRIFHTFIRRVAGTFHYYDVRLLNLADYCGSHWNWMVNEVDD